MLYKSVAVLLVIAFVVDAKIKPRKLYRGRPLDGFLPKPPHKYAVDSFLSNSITSGWFTQKLDHFDSTVTTTWQQKWQKNSNLYKPGGPMFVMISGEGPADISWMSYGQWYKNARTYGALMFQLEHRYYGTSHPTPDVSTENLKYLTSKQALADLDVFIQGMQVQYNISQVVVFGGSYAGDLAAFYRAKYNTALGSIASSGPVTAELDFYQYMETVSYGMDYFTPGCSDQVSQAIQSLQQLVANQDTPTISTLFDPCKPLNYSDAYEIDTFFSSIMNPWMGAVQYSAPDAADAEVAQMCQVVMNPSNGADPLHRLSYLYKNEIGNCIDTSYQEEITLLKQTGWNDPWVSGGSRQWIWQTCNEFGFYQSTTSKNQPFGQTVPIDYIVDTSCTKVFGQTMSQVQTNVDQTNQYYGATKGNEKKVFLPNGSVDPWHNLAIYQVAPDPSDTLGYMNGTSHCYDMGNDLSTDPPQLTQVRNQITQQIGQWLQ